MTPFLTIYDHLKARGTRSPGEVELTVGQARTMLKDGRLSCVKLRSRTVESQNFPFLYHNQTSPMDLSREHRLHVTTTLVSAECSKPSSLCGLLH